MEKKYLISALKPKIEAFLAFKNSLGIEYSTAKHHLRSLDEYNYYNGNSEFLLKEIVEAWAVKKDSKSITQDRSWIPPIREFGKYLRRIGEDAYILNDNFKIRKYHAETYLMNENEIKAFFKECDRFAAQIKNNGRYVLPAIYRFMYSCGVRTCEVVKLKCSEVNLEKKYIDIILSKRHKDRRLFLNDELCSYLQDYDKRISAFFPEREYFFINTHGNRCAGRIISVNFKKIWLNAGLNYSGTVKPRAYDFRHHFACANLIRWSKEKKDINAMLPYLMKYMGHSSIVSTYYYIHLLPDFYPQYKSLVSISESLIPEVDYEI